MLPWRLATQALDSTVTFLNTTDCRTGRRARQSRPAQIPTSWALCWWIGRRSGGIPAIVGGRLRRRRLRGSIQGCGLADRLLLRIRGCRLGIA